MSALEFVSTFFSPTYLFLFLNLIIGTIFITSRLGFSHRHRPAMLTQPVPLARAPSSLIDRVRSINLSLYKFESHPETDPVHHDHTGPLVRAPSLLGRLRSINFHHHKFDDIEPEPEPEPLPRLDPPAPLSRAPSSLLDRLKSINLYYQKFDRSGGPAMEPDRSMDAPPEHEYTNHQSKDRGHCPVRRVISESGKMSEQGPKPHMRKTLSEKSAVDVDSEEINARADDFIQRFRNQLRLQRLDSIMRYKDMLTGGRGR